MKVRPLVDGNFFAADFGWKQDTCYAIVTVQSCNGYQFNTRLGLVEHAIKVGRYKKEIIGGVTMYRELHSSQWGSEL
jgi:hypothetical protein